VATVPGEFRAHARDHRPDQSLSSRPIRGTAYGHARRPFRPATKMVFVVPQGDPQLDYRSLTTEGDLRRWTSPQMSDRCSSWGFSWGSPMLSPPSLARWRSWHDIYELERFAAGRFAQF
jgi:hypothetical protein